MPQGSVVLLEHDWYYRDRTEISSEERERINYDHPDAIETELMVEHLAQLRAGHAIQAPQYDFRQHVRRPDAVAIAPTRIAIVEGILVLADARLRAQMDLKLFVDTDADIRLMRRIRRDMESRGRSFAQVREQYYETVRPMHQAYVEPSKRFADLIIPEGGENQAALDMIVARLHRALAG